MPCSGSSSTRGLNRVSFVSCIGEADSLPTEPPEKPICSHTQSKEQHGTLTELSSAELKPGEFKVSHYICDVSASNRQDVLSFNVKIKLLYQQQTHPFHCKWVDRPTSGCKVKFAFELKSWICVFPHTSPPFVHKGMLLSRPLQFQSISVVSQFVFSFYLK